MAAAEARVPRVPDGHAALERPPLRACDGEAVAEARALGYELVAHDMNGAALHAAALTQETTSRSWLL